MAVGLRKRVERLEVQREAASPQRLVLICQEKGESSSEAIERHGLVPGAHGLIILQRYGAAACWCRQHGGEENAAAGTVGENLPS